MTQTALSYGGSRVSPMISVVTPVYNAQAYVAEAIDSIVRQTYPHWELIIVMDGASSDASQAIAESYAARDSRIRLCFSPHHGLSETLNVGITAANGDYIALCDADDIAAPDRLNVQLRWLEAAGLDIGGGCAQCVGDTQMVMWFPEDHETIRMDLLFRPCLLPSTVMARASVLKENLFAPGVAFQDYELWMRLAPRYRLGNMQHVLAQYRRHDGQVTRGNATRLRADQRSLRRAYFFSLFGDAGEDDYEAFARLADEHPHLDLADLERAGFWITRLAQPPDAFYRKRLARRWLVACRRAAHLGPQCHRIYQKAARELEAGVVLEDMRLRLMCAGRIRLDSRLLGAARRMRFLPWGHTHAAS